MRSRLQVIRSGRRPHRGPRHAHPRSAKCSKSTWRRTPAVRSGPTRSTATRPTHISATGLPARSTPSAAPTSTPGSTASPPTMAVRPPTERCPCCARSIDGPASTMTGCATRSISGLPAAARSTARRGASRRDCSSTPQTSGPLAQFARNRLALGPYCKFLRQPILRTQSEPRPNSRDTNHRQDLYTPLLQCAVFHAFSLIYILLLTFDSHFL